LPASGPKQQQTPAGIIWSGLLAAGRLYFGGTMGAQRALWPLNGPEVGATGRPRHLRQIRRRRLASSPKLLTGRLAAEKAPPPQHFAGSQSRVVPLGLKPLESSSFGQNWRRANLEAADCLSRECPRLSAARAKWFGSANWRCFSSACLFFTVSASLSLSFPRSFGPD